MNLGLHVITSTTFSYATWFVRYLGLGVWQVYRDHEIYQRCWTYLPIAPAAKCELSIFEPA